MTPSPQRRGRWLAAAGIGAIALVALAAVLVTRGGEDDEAVTAAATTAPAVSSEAAPATEAPAATSEAATAAATGPDPAAQIATIRDALDLYFARNGPQGAVAERIAVSDDAATATAIVSAPGLDPVAVTLARTGGVWQVLQLGPSVDCAELPGEVTSLLGAYCN